MYWWLGIWIGVVAGVLAGVAISIFVQMMDLDRQTILDWVRGAPGGWGPRTLRCWRTGRKWADEMYARLCSGEKTARFAWAGVSGRSEKKVDASFYRDLYRDMSGK